MKRRAGAIRPAFLLDGEPGVADFLWRVFRALIASPL